MSLLRQSPFRMSGAIRTLLVSACVAVLPAFSLHAQETAPATAQESAAVMSVVTTLFDGMRKGDSSVVRSVFDPRVRMITVTMRNGARRTSLEMGADNFAKAIGTPHADVYDERIRNERISMDGDLASVWVDYAFFAGTKFSHCGSDHFLLVRNESGAWKILELADTRRTTGCEQWTK
jgi:hypothetical protein